MAEWLRDDIDFAAYMGQTDHDHHVARPLAFADQVADHFWDETRPRGHTLPWPKTHDKIRFRAGEVTLWAGINGHGKSLALGQLAIGLACQRTVAAIASLEMKPVITLARMCRQGLGCAKPSRDLIHTFHQATDKYLWLYDQQGMVAADRMIGVMRYCAEVKGCTHFMLDSFLKCGIAEDDYTAQKHFIDRICTVGRDTGMHCHVVVHSKKTKDESTPPGKMDIKGSGSIADQADNVLSWYRNKPKEEALRQGKEVKPGEPDAILTIDKQRNGDWEGALKFWFEPASLQFHEAPDALPLDLFDRKHYA